jgi:Ser/Thr protein kinase RdoA (MazF antagonist)
MRSPRVEIGPLRPLLESLVGEIEAIDPLPSGASGQSYRLRTPAGEFAAKIFLPDAPALLGPCDQFALLGVLAASGIAPKPVACDAGARLLVTEFLADAATVTALALLQSEHIAALAALLRKLHAVAYAVPPYAPRTYAESYLVRSGGLQALSRADRARWDELIALVARPLPGPPCLCHNDLTAENLLLGRRLRLIDFDYAALAAPILDLASVVFMNALPPATADQLLEAYYDGPAPYSVEEFARVQRLIALLAHFWALAAGENAAAVVAAYRIRDD